MELVPSPVLSGGLLVLQRQAIVAIGHHKGVVLPGQQRLNKGEQHNEQHQKEQKHGHPVFRKARRVERQ